MWMISLVLWMLAIWGTVITMVNAEDPTINIDWDVTYGWASPLGFPQKVILINGLFPGPPIECETNNKLIVNVFNHLNESFLVTWNGIKQRKNCWQDGVLGTNCPIPPNTSWTYIFQAKDQIGSFTYFPSIKMQRAAGGFGIFNIIRRPVISIPYDPPAGNFSLLIGDWWRISHKKLIHIAKSDGVLPTPDAILINGSLATNVSGDAGKKYMFRVSNIGLSTHINFRIQNHSLQLVEIEGCHVNQTHVDSIDIYVGQSAAFLVTFDQNPKASYHIVASSTFMDYKLTGLGLLRYTNSTSDPVGPTPPGPDGNITWSMEQARLVRWNLNANAARPNPQGSYHYSAIKVNRTITLENSSPRISGRQKYAMNRIVYVNPRTPLKLADYFRNITGVFNATFPENATLSEGVDYRQGTYVIEAAIHEYVEVVFQNKEGFLQTFHLDGYDFWFVGMGIGRWNEECRGLYNMKDAPTRHTVQVYPKSWSAIRVKLDNMGMWNLRSAIWARQFLGQQLYVKVNDSVKSNTTEYPMPPNAIRCGKALDNNLVPKIILT